MRSRDPPGPGPDGSPIVPMPSLRRELPCDLKQPLDLIRGRLAFRNGSDPRLIDGLTRCGSQDGCLENLGLDERARSSTMQTTVPGELPTRRYHRRCKEFAQLQSTVTDLDDQTVEPHVQVSDSQ